MLEAAFELLESCKSNFPFIAFVLLPILLAVSPANGSQSFPVYRVQQFDMGGTFYGSRSTYVSMEARTMTSDMLTRKCVVAKAADLTIDQIHKMIELNVGALLILIPQNLSSVSETFIERFSSLERYFLSEEITMPIYLSEENDKMKDLYNELDRSSDSNPATAIEALTNAVFANGFQFSVALSSARKLSSYKTINIHGVLEGQSSGGDVIPTIVLVAHYDSFGMAPSLTYGASSPGTGVALLMELMRIFSRLYSEPSSKAPFNLVFLASGGGNTNYFGSKKWIEEMKDSQTMPYLSGESSNSLIVVCLDSISDQKPITVHSTKEYQDGIMYAFIKHLEVVSAQYESSVRYNIAKVPMSDIQFNWEHQMFRMQMIRNTVTLSTNNDKDSPIRRSILDVSGRIDRSVFSKNSQIIGESLARLVFSRPVNTNTIQVLDNQLALQPSMLSSWLDLITSQPRSSQLISPNHDLLQSLETSFKRYTQHVHISKYSTDSKNPEFVLYDGAQANMDIYSVKPAVFDLILAVFLAAYLTAVYVIVQFVYPVIYSSLIRKKPKTN